MTREATRQDGLSWHAHRSKHAYPLTAQKRVNSRREKTAQVSAVGGKVGIVAPRRTYNAAIWCALMSHGFSRCRSRGRYNRKSSAGKVEGEIRPEAP